jgi:Mg/Co/Ni transporter MgtE
MNLSSIEITEKEYLIKLNKQDFDLSLINTLIKRIQAETFFKSMLHEDEEDIISKRANDQRINLFDHLDDK